MPCRHPPHCLLSLLAFAVVWFAHETFGVSIASVYPIYGSTLGGTYLVIDGSGFMFPTEANPWDSQVVYVGNINCNIVAHYTSATRIVCLTGAWPTPYVDSAWLTVTVQVFSGLGGAQNAMKTSAFKYREWDTPKLFWARHWAATGGDRLGFGGYMHPTLSSSEQMEVRIGQVICVMDQEDRPLTASWALKYADCLLPTGNMVQTGHFNLTMRLRALDPASASCPNSACFPTAATQVPTSGNNGWMANHGFGLGQVTPHYDRQLARLDLTWAGTVQLESGLPYDFTIYPQIDSVTPTAGGIHGGNLLTIDGSSFSEVPEDNIVTIGGRPCVVVSATTTQLLCRIGDRRLASANRTTLRGLVFRSYRGGYPPWTGNGPRPAPFDSGVLKARVDYVNQCCPRTNDLDGTNDQYFRETIGYFVPPLTASYTFYIAGDDIATISISSDETISGLTTIATLPAWNPTPSYWETHPGIWFHRPTVGRTATGPTEQVSNPVNLIAGKRYAFRINFIAYGGAEWMRMAVKVGKLSTATRADGTTLGPVTASSIARLMPAMEIQLFSLKMKSTLKREEHYIRVGNTQAKHWILRVVNDQGQDTTVPLQASAQASDIRTAIRDAKIHGTNTYILHRIPHRDITVAGTTASNQRNFTVRVNKPLQDNMVQYITLEVYSAGDAHPQVGLTQKGSQALGGTYRVGYDGVWSNPINIRSNNWNNQPLQIRNISRAWPQPIELEAWPWSTNGNFEGFETYVRFREPAGDVALIQYDTSGLRGEDYEFSVKTIENGDADATMIERFPADYFEMLEPSQQDLSPVRVVTNGVLGASGSVEAPSYALREELTPMLFGVSPSVVHAGTMLTVFVGNLQVLPNSTNVSILIGNSTQCADISDVTVEDVGASTTNRTLQCVVQRGPAGVHEVKLRSYFQGDADPLQPFLITYELSIGGISPQVGSLFGGTAITLQGDGVVGLGCSKVAVGGRPCTDVLARGPRILQPWNGIVCLVPPLPGLDPSNMSVWPDVVQSPIRILEPPSQAHHVRGLFSYAANNTPLVESITPSTWSAVVSTFVKLKGSRLGSVAHAPYVQFGNRTCTIKSHSSSEVVCWLQRLNQAPPADVSNKLLFFTFDEGFAAVRSSLDSRFEIRATNLMNGSRAGGAIINISGAYLHHLNASKHTVTVKFSTGVQRTCVILGGSTTQLRCQLVGGAPGVTASSKARRLLSTSEALVTASAPARGQCHDGDLGRPCRFAKSLLESGNVRSFAHAAESVVSDFLKIHPGTLNRHYEEVETFSRRLAEVNMELSANESNFSDSGNLSNASYLSTPPPVLAGTTAGSLYLSSSTNFSTTSNESTSSSYSSESSTTVTTNISIQLRASTTSNVSIHTTRSTNTTSIQSTTSTTTTTTIKKSTTSFLSIATPSEPEPEAEPEAEPEPEVGDLSVALSSIKATCASDQGCSFTYDAKWTPVLMDVFPLEGYPANGTNVTLVLRNVPADASISVRFGPNECAIAERWEDRRLGLFGGMVDALVLVVPLCEFEAAVYPVYIFVHPYGYALRASPYTGASFKFWQRLMLFTLSPSFGSIYGGSDLILHGSGFPSHIPAIRVHVGSAICNVSSVSLDKILCFTPSSPQGTTSTENVHVQVLGNATHVGTIVRIGLGAEPEPEPEPLGTPGTGQVSAGLYGWPSQTSPLHFSYGGDHPVISKFENDGDRVLRIKGSGFGSGSFGRVTLGSAITPWSNLNCSVLSWNVSYISCEFAPEVPAGSWRVRVWLTSKGWSNDAPTLLHITSMISAIESSGMVFPINSTDALTDALPYSGFGGGVELILHGTGLGLEPFQQNISLCKDRCYVTRANGTQAACITPARVTQDLVQNFPSAFPSEELAPYAESFYTDWGSVVNEASIANRTFTASIDQEINLYYAGKYWNRWGCWFGFQLPAHKWARVTTVAFFPPTNPTRRNRAAQTKFEVRNLTGSWVEVATMANAVVTGASVAQGWTAFDLNPPVLAQAFRVRILPNGCAHTDHQGELMRGARFRGIIMDVDNSGVCGIEIDRVLHPFATHAGSRLMLPIQFHHRLALTPVLSSIWPRQGTARGDTVITLAGQGLTPQWSSALAGPSVATGMRVMFNGYPCNSLSMNASEASCMTTERNRGITAPSTSVWIAGKGLALIVGSQDATTFSYIDKWSDVHSWLDSEPPIDGDTVIVPEGQAILLDQDSPKLFLVLVSGILEFARQDLSFNATYIWVAGGEFRVGTETEPFLNQATITLHGDRWYTIELPFIGSKMLTVTNRGGLHGGCHLQTTQTAAVQPCPVKSVGKLDLHGQPGTSWTRLAETAWRGSNILKLIDPVDWPVGARIVITPSHSGQNEEVRLVQSVRDGGYTVEVDQRLQQEHLGIWFYHGSVTPTDLRAGVGLLSRNVKIQGDDHSARPGNAFMFGAHTGAFFGGELRIENVEFFRTGQAGNFGRYSSHWHNLSPGRNVDVIGKAYLRNNSYHDTFQRATTVHGTDYAVVRDNVAHLVHGHMYFTEVGDEDFTLFEHNLAVHTLKHPLLLTDDTSPAGFWLPGFTGWHRSNLAANCVRGWRLKVQAGAGAQAHEYTFFNNSAHACGFGWHLKPPHAPSVTNHFTTFTAFRCSTGMFYYGTGNIFHDDHRFVECGTGHFMNHLSNSIHTAPFFHDLVLIGNIDPESTQSRSGLGIRAPKDNENFFVTGMTVINYHNTAVLFGCHKVSCTMRFERARWFKSNVRTRSDTGVSGIYWDLDGTLTGHVNGFVCFKSAFNKFPGVCVESSQHSNGLVCSSSNGKLRVRRLYIDGQKPSQLDGKVMNVNTVAGQGTVPFVWKDGYGWYIPAVEGQAYEIKVNDPNDFQKLKLTYSYAPYVFESHGHLQYQSMASPRFTINQPLRLAVQGYTKVLPVHEAVTVHLLYTDWRDHFDARLNHLISGRMPNRNDVFGTFAQKLDQDMCALYNISLAAPALQAQCGYYTNETGLALKAFLNAQPWLPQVKGRLTTVLSGNTTEANGVYTPNPSWLTSLWQDFTAQECPNGGCPTPPPTSTPVYTTWRLWSDASRWPTGQVPNAWDNVDILASEHVILDIVTPVLNWVTVTGKLEASRVANSTLNARSVIVWGQLIIGNLSHPLPANVKSEIVLHGDMFAQTVIGTSGSFLVNKVVAVYGRLSAAGSPLNQQAWTKLASTAIIGAQKIVMRGNFTLWPVGADVGIGPTEYPTPPETTDTEVRQIAGPPVYDAAADTTTLTLNQSLVHRHFAGVVSDPANEAHAPFVELAASVALLRGRSNVVFRNGEPSTEHGGVLTIGGSKNGVWAGSANISDVDFVRMGKHLYQHPALHFNFLDSSRYKSRSIVQRCVFSHSQSGAIQLDGAANVNITGNVFHRTYRTALWLGKTTLPSSIRVRSNLAMETLRHPKETTAWVRPFAAFLLEVQTLELTGNVAAGSADSGFVIRPTMISCFKGASNSPPKENNEAVGCLTGFFLLKACPGLCNQCARLRGATVWKSAHFAVGTVDQTSNMRLDSLVLSDNHVGISTGFYRPSWDIMHRLYVHNVTVFGSTVASTCAASTTCRAIGINDRVGTTCNSVVGGDFRRAGILTYVINGQAKLCESNSILKVCRPPNTPVKKCVMPWDHRVGTVGSKYSESHWSELTFGFFNSNDCGKPSVAFTLNPTGPDITFPHYFSNVRWLSSAHADARFYFQPMVGNPLNRLKHCRPGASCDSLLQLAFVDTDGTLLGTGRAGGSLVADAALSTQHCQPRLNYYACDQLKLRMLKWEAINGFPGRNLGSFKIWRQSDGRASWSQGPFMGKCPLPQDPEYDRNFQVRVNDYHNLTFFVSPPKHHMFTFFDDDADAIRIALRLSQPFRLEVYVDGTKLPDKTYDTAINSNTLRYPVLSDPHGSYAFDPQARTFFLVLHGGIHSGLLPTEGGGKTLLRLLQCVQLSMTVSVPVQQFDSSNLVSNLALLLSIDPSRIKIVQVQSKAQVAAGGRRLADPNATSTSTALVLQIVEANPAPLPANAFIDPSNLTWNQLSSLPVAQGTNSTVVSSGGPTQSNATPSQVTPSGFSIIALAELQQIGNTIQVQANQGLLSAALGVPVFVTELLVTDPMAAVNNQVSNSTSTTPPAPQTVQVWITGSLVLGVVNANYFVAQTSIQTVMRQSVASVALVGESSVRISSDVMVTTRRLQGSQSSRVLLIYTITATSASANVTVSNLEATNLTEWSEVINCCSKLQNAGYLYTVQVLEVTSPTVLYSTATTSTSTTKTRAATTTTRIAASSQDHSSKSGSTLERVLIIALPIVAICVCFFLGGFFVCYCRKSGKVEDASQLFMNTLETDKTAQENVAVSHQWAGRLSSTSGSSAGGVGDADTKIPSKWAEHFGVSDHHKVKEGIKEGPKPLSEACPGSYPRHSIPENESQTSFSMSLQSPEHPGNVKVTPPNDGSDSFDGTPSKLRSVQTLQSVPSVEFVPEVHGPVELERDPKQARQGTIMSIHSVPTSPTSKQDTDRSTQDGNSNAAVDASPQFLPVNSTSSQVSPRPRLLEPIQRPPSTQAGGEPDSSTRTLPLQTMPLQPTVLPRSDTAPNAVSKNRPPFELVLSPQPLSPPRNETALSIDGAGPQPTEVWRVESYWSSDHRQQLSPQAKALARNESTQSAAPEQLSPQPKSLARNESTQSAAPEAVPFPQPANLSKNVSTLTVDGSRQQPGLSQQPSEVWRVESYWSAAGDLGPSAAGVTTVAASQRMSGKPSPSTHTEEAATSPTHDTQDYPGSPDSAESAATGNASRRGSKVGAAKVITKPPMDVEAIADAQLQDAQDHAAVAPPAPPPPPPYHPDDGNLD